MTNPLVDSQLLQEFERSLDPRHPESGPIPTRVLGYGEISCVLQIHAVGLENMACKRMPMFESDAEVEQYVHVYKEYLRLLRDQLGINTPDSDILWFRNNHGGQVTAYILQEQLDSDSIASALIHQLDDTEIERLITAILDKIKRVFAFNAAHKGSLELGFDGQLSNWAMANAGQQQAFPDEIELLYFDTSTPLIQLRGNEQLNTELFLRSAPSFLHWIVRALFLEDVVTRYYDIRKVAIDLLANLYKEQRADLVPRLLALVNDELAAESEYMPVTLDEVSSYYREDAFIWRLYLALRKLDRRLHELRNKPYPYILPDEIKR